MAYQFEEINTFIHREKKRKKEEHCFLIIMPLIFLIYFVYFILTVICTKNILLLINTQLK